MRILVISDVYPNKALESAVGYQVAKNENWQAAFITPHAVRLRNYLWATIGLSLVIISVAFYSMIFHHFFFLGFSNPDVAYLATFGSTLLGSLALALAGADVCQRLALRGAGKAAARLLSERRLNLVVTNGYGAEVALKNQTLSRLPTLMISPRWSCPLNRLHRVPLAWLVQAARKLGCWWRRRVTHSDTEHEKQGGNDSIFSSPEKELTLNGYNLENASFTAIAVEKRYRKDLARFIALCDTAPHGTALYEVVEDLTRPPAQEEQEHFENLISTIFQNGWARILHKEQQIQHLQSQDENVGAFSDRERGTVGEGRGDVAVAEEETEIPLLSDDRAGEHRTRSTHSSGSDPREVSRARSRSGSLDERLPPRTSQASQASGASRASLARRDSKAQGRSRNLLQRRNSFFDHTDQKDIGDWLDAPDIPLINENMP